MYEQCLSISEPALYEEGEVINDFCVRRVILNMFYILRVPNKGNVMNQT